MLPFDLGGSTPVLCPSVSVARCLLGFAGGTPVPPLELGYSTLFVRASDASRYASTSVSPFYQGCASWWPGRRLRGHPGVASAARCSSTSAAVHRCRALRSRWFVVSWLRRRTPVSPHELGYPTPFIRASDVPLRVAVMVPVFFSLGLVVVHCQWWNKLLSLPLHFVFFLLVLGFLLKPSPVIFFCAFVHLLVSVLTAKSLSSGNITSGGVFGPPVNLEKKRSCVETRPPSLDYILPKESQKGHGLMEASWG